MALLDDSGKVIHLNNADQKYIRKDLKKIFGFPKGKIRIGDVLVSISKKNNEFDLKLKVAGNDEIKPFSKRVADSGESIVEIVYNGIAFSARREKEGYCLNINTSEFDFRDNDRTFTAVVNPGGIQFYVYNNQELVEEILKDGHFDAYIEERECYGQLEELFCPEYIDAVINNKQSGVFKGEAFELDRRVFGCGNWNITELIVADADCLMDEVRRKEKKLAEFKKLELNNEFSGFHFWGNDEKIKKIERLLQKGSVTNTTILLKGESGTGKTYTAYEIHKRSKRAEKPFVHVNCAAIPYELLESELFGYETGAFTGARKNGKPGLIEEAYGGTLFLDEITELPLQIQGKLLEIMQSKTYYKVGGTKKLKADVRIIVATNRELRKLIKEHRFREDLYYRINAFPIELPPLRERKTSIRGIIADILPAVCENLDIEPVIMSAGAMEKIKTYSWPGNIRELENVLEKAAILCENQMILPEDVVFEDFEETLIKPHTLKQLKEQCERDAIRHALDIFHNDKEKAARFLEIGRTQMFEKIKKYNLIEEGNWKDRV